MRTKYYVPDEIWPRQTYDDFFSGAAYVMKGSFALKVAKYRDSTPGLSQKLKINNILTLCRLSICYRMSACKLSDFPNKDVK